MSIFPWAYYLRTLLCDFAHTSVLSPLAVEAGLAAGGAVRAGVAATAQQ